MNKDPIESKQLIKEIVSGLGTNQCKVIVCVPFVDINEAVKLTKDTNIKVGAQNCHFESCGAYTGEVSPSMLKSTNTDYVILGHSERRNYFGETDELINKKINSAIKSGLKVILCVGETLEEKEKGITKEKISLQIKQALYGVNKEDLLNVIIAYEPVWAIGTGKTATNEEAEYVCKTIRETIKEVYNVLLSEKIFILYGGSMNPQNAQGLLNMPNIDGGLIGGASLIAEDFLKIINIASKIKL